MEVEVEVTWYHDARQHACYGVPGRTRAIGENTRKYGPHHRRLNNHEKYPAYNGSHHRLEAVYRRVNTRSTD